MNGCPFLHMIHLKNLKLNWIACYPWLEKNMLLTLVKKYMVSYLEVFNCISIFSLCLY